MNTSIIILIIVVVLAVITIGIYNKLIALIEAVNNNQKQIDIQLDRRFKVFESLINVVKNYMDYEKSTLRDIIGLRAQAEKAQANGDSAARMAAENKISNIASGLNVVFEQYPDLKANQNALQLQEEIVNTENKLAFAKQAFNDSVEVYSASKKSFPNNIIVGAFRASLDKNFAYWNLPSDKIAEREDYTVKM